MATDIQYDAENGILRVVLSGPLDPAEVKNVLQNILMNPAIPNDSDSIWDLRKLDFSTANQKTIQAVVTERTAVADRRAGAKSAFVVSAMDEEILVRLYQAHTQHIQRESRIFRTVEDAQQWLRGRDRQDQPA